MSARLVTVALVLLIATVHAQTPVPELSADDLAILRLAMHDGPHELSGWNRAGIRPELMASTATMCSSAATQGCVDETILRQDGPGNFLGLERERYSMLLSDFRRRNTQSWSLERVRTDLRSAWPDPSVSGPTGSPWFVQVTLPAYSQDGRAALVFVSGFSECRGGCSYWAKILGFVRRSNEWTCVGGRAVIS
jgi:hypothetical protein